MDIVQYNLNFVKCTLYTEFLKSKILKLHTSPFCTLAIGACTVINHPNHRLCDTLVDNFFLVCTSSSPQAPLTGQLHLNIARPPATGRGFVPPTHPD